MKISVDQRKCMTAGVCVMEAPAIFRFQEGSKKATVAPEEIPPALWPLCRKIAQKCPTGAIAILEDAPA